MTQERFENLVFEYPEVVARMMWHQHNLGREIVFGPEIDDRGPGKGFFWGRTPEGVKFWADVMNGKEIQEDVVPYYEKGDRIQMKYRDSIRNYRFLMWDIEHKAVWVMTDTAWLLINSREASDTLHQDIRKMPIQNIVWNIQ